jgi:hypothetical protein
MLLFEYFLALWPSFQAHLYSVLDLELAISPKEPSSFQWELILQTSTWVSDILIPVVDITIRNSSQLER